MADWFSQNAPAPEVKPDIRANWFSQNAPKAESQPKATADLYPMFSKIPGFEHVRPAFDAAAGAGVAAADHAANMYDFLRKIPGADKLLPDSSEFHKAITAADPHTMSSEIGKAGEGIAEFMLPAGKMAEATKGAGFLARAGGQAAVGGGISAVQSGGDPGSIATGAAFGAGGEALSDIAKGAKALLAGKAPTLANFSESFGNATPTQKARISKAIDILERDGIVPPDSVHEMQDIVKSRLDDIGKAYQSLDPAIAAREVDPSGAIGELRKVQAQYMRRGVVTNDTAHAAIEKEIANLQDIAKANNGKVNVEDIVHLKQNANGRTNFNSPDADKSLWRGIGDAYRSTADTIAPEITPLNRDYQKYKDLEQIVDQNISRGKGTTPSGLSALMDRGAQHGAGAAAGAAIGSVAGPVGTAAGTAAGAIIGPKLGKAAAQAVQNAVDAGVFQRLAPVKQQAIRAASAIGDNSTVLRLLGTSAIEEGNVSK